jgi:recombinational DNA repair protein RecR
MNLIPAIRAIREQISDIEHKHAEELAPYKDSLESLQKINTACEKCGGSGRVMRPRLCAEDDRDREMIQCNLCHGTGLSDKAAQP